MLIISQQKILISIITTENYLTKLVDLIICVKYD